MSPLLLFALNSISNKVFLICAWRKGICYLMCHRHLFVSGAEAQPKSPPNRASPMQRSIVTCFTQGCIQGFEDVCHPPIVPRIKFFSYCRTPLHPLVLGIHTREPKNTLQKWQPAHTRFSYHIDCIFLCLLEIGKLSQSFM